jgi:hypothetical protein
VSFKSVRVVVLASVAEKYGLMLQRLGRALRSCSHDRLPEAERALEQRMYKIELPTSYDETKKKPARRSKKAIALAGNSKSPNTTVVTRSVSFVSPDSVLYDKLVHDKPVVDQAMLKLASYAIDRSYLSSGVTPPRVSPSPRRPLSPRTTVVAGNGGGSWSRPTLQRASNVARAITSRVTGLLARARPGHRSNGLPFVPKHAPRAYADAQAIGRL